MDATCFVCDEKWCSSDRCKEILLSIDEIKIEHSVEEIIQEIYS